MTREAIINKTLKVLSSFPADKVAEVSDFASYILKKHEDDTLKQGIEKLIEGSIAFDFLKDEEDIYTLSDVKENY